MTHLPQFVYVKMDDDPTIQYMSVQALMLLFVTYANEQHINIFHMNLVSDLIQGFGNGQMEINIGNRKVCVSQKKERIHKMLTPLH